MTTRLTLNGQAQTVYLPFNAQIYGTLAPEAIRVGAGATVGFFLGSGDTVDLPQALAAYSTKIQGNVLQLTSETGAVSLILNEEPTTVRFADGSAQVSLTGLGQASLGGRALNATPAVYSAADLGAGFDASIKSNATMTVSAWTGALRDQLVLDSDNSTVRLGFSADVYGSNGAEVVQVEDGAIVKFLAGAGDRLELPGTLANYKVYLQGNIAHFVGQQDISVVLNDAPLAVRFADGEASMSLTGLGHGVLGGAAVSETQQAYTAGQLGAAFNSALKAAFWTGAGSTQPPAPTPTGVTGGVAIGAVIAGQSIALTATDGDLNTDATTAQTVSVSVTNGSTGEAESVLLTETGPNTGIFAGTLASANAAGAGAGNSGSLNVFGGQTVQLSYNDALDASGATNQTRTASALASAPAAPAGLSGTAAAFSRIDADIGDLLPSGAAGVVSLRSGEAWTKTALTYSFNTSAPADYTGIETDSTASGTLTAGWLALNDAEKAAVQQTLSSLSNLLPVTFTEVAGNAGDLRFNVLPILGTTAGFAYSPSSAAIGGDVFLSSANRDKYGSADGDYGKLVVVHEIGHAMGLKHPFESPDILATALDDHTHTVMSYTSGRSMLLDFTASGGHVNVQGNYLAYPSDYSLLDVGALQAAYGANTSYRTGADTYSVSFSQHRYETIWDAGGSDTLEAASALGACAVDLRPGSFCSMDVHGVAMQQADTQAYFHGLGVNWADSWVAGVYADTAYTAHLYTGENNVAIANGVWLENVSTGAGADTIRDNAVDNVIKAGSGDDLIQLFEGGYDTVDGGAGTDTVQVNNTRAQVQTEKQADGNYLVAGSYFGAKLIGVEKLLFSDGELLLA